MKTLELKDIAAYLPYGLKYLYEGKTIGEVRMEDYDTTIDSMLCLNCIIKPILRPMSDLTKEITHRGETFVPIVRLADIVCPEYQWVLNEKGAGCIDARDARHTLWFDLNTIYTRTYIPPFSKQLERIVISPQNQVLTYDMLAEWMFDYRGLIPAGLAVDVNTLDKNPYEV